MSRLKLKPMSTLKPNHRVLAFESDGFPLLGHLYISEQGVRTFQTDGLIKSAETVAGWIELDDLWQSLDKAKTLKTYERELREYLGYP